MFVTRTFNLFSSLNSYRKPYLVDAKRWPLMSSISFGRVSTHSATTIQCELDANFLSSPADSLSHQHLIVLNYTLPTFTPFLWRRSKLRVVGDGGANRLYNLLVGMRSRNHPGSSLPLKFLPDAICGDLDSIRSDVRHFYESQDVEIRDLSYDQDTTDTHKCINYLKEKLVETSRKETVLIVGSLGGRLDHTLSNLNTLHRFPELNMVMIGEGNCARVIKEGRTKIQVDPEVEGPKCAIVPLNGPVRVTATGLKWPLDDHLLEFTGLISTSNSLISDVVVVQTSGPVVWITTLDEDKVCERLKHEF